MRPLHFSKEMGLFEELRVLEKWTEGQVEDADCASWTGKIPVLSENMLSLILLGTVSAVDKQKAGR